MGEQYNIKNLNDLLSVSNKTVLSYKAKPLTAAGENYGSLMLALDIFTKNESDNTEEVLKVVAKLPPPNLMLKIMFDIPVTFKKEIGFYNVIAPTLQQFQMEEGINAVMDLFPKCFGSRISLNPESESVDDDAVLLLENMKLSGFTTGDCMKGFDLEETNFIIKDLAHFHAVPIALKLKKPEVFQNKLRPYLPSNPLMKFISDELAEKMTAVIVDIIKSEKDTAHLADDVYVAVKRCNDYYKHKIPHSPAREPYASMTHNDYWTNNTMVKYEHGKIIKNVMVDFQLLEYGSPASDILFFLFSSVQKKILDAHYDEIIDLYYATFIDTLKALKCDTSPFTFEQLQKEIKIEATLRQFLHVLGMMRPICSVKGKVKDLSEMTEADMLTTDHLSELYPRKLCETVLSFSSRNWI